MTRVPAWAPLLGALALALLCPACGSGERPRLAPADGPDSADVPRRVSPYEVDVPYVDEGTAIWDRPDLFVMDPDRAPLDRWPDEVLFPADHGVRIVVLLPGDYRDRSNGRLPAGVLYVESSGTETAPILICFAPYVGADLRETPHAAERASEARLGAFRIWQQDHQVIHGLTFRDGVSACLVQEAAGCVIDGCLWHETSAQPLRLRFGAQENHVQRCVFRRFLRDQWAGGDTVAIQVSDGACTHNRVVSNVILNYTDAYQHTDREGEPYGLGAGTILDNNVMGFTPEAYVPDPAGELMCGENTIDLKMGGTEAEPVRVTNNVFFGVRAARAGCAASGSGGYAVTCHRRGTWVEIRGNSFVDCDAGVFLNAFFAETDPALGRIDPHLVLTGNLFSAVRSHAAAFPDRTGRVLTGSSPAAFTENAILDSDRLMEREPVPGPWELAIEGNTIYGALDLEPRDEARLRADDNAFRPAVDAAWTELRVPWTDLVLRYLAPR